MSEPCLCRDDDEYGRNPDGECFCGDGRRRCSCTACTESFRAYLAESAGDTEQDCGCQACRDSEGTWA